MWRTEIKIEKEVGKDQHCGEGGNSRMRGENNKIVEEGIKKNNSFLITEYLTPFAII